VAHDAVDYREILGAVGGCVPRRSGRVSNMPIPSPWLLSQSTARLKKLIAVACYLRARAST
jgi:hypothetical protein